jgi:hypothetical protein
LSDWHPGPKDHAEAARIFTAMDALNLGVQDFAQGLMEVSPDFAQALAEHLEREFALENTVEKTLMKSVA